jgi:xanthine dehydrogenase YagS FAD-binding subunit
MREFAYARPEHAEEAVRLVAAGDAAYLAGGTNLVDLTKLEVARPGLLVDITALGVDFVTEKPGGGLRIGAGTRNSDLAASPLVRRGVPGAGPGHSRGRLRAAAQPGDGRRQPAAAHPLLLLPGR